MAEQEPALPKERPRGLSKDSVWGFHFITPAGQKDKKDFMSLPNPKEHFYFRGAIWQENRIIMGASNFQLVNN